MEHRYIAADGLMTMLSKSNRDLSSIHTRLEREFQQVYPDNTNPMKLVKRLKEIDEEMPRTSVASYLPPSR